ncbi:hypothetical protein LTR85_012250 [Meristemomyces frigidus]|nr:hypothetical protein LTR85_012250 [Meristemomyces frigidus]
MSATNLEVFCGDIFHFDVTGARFTVHKRLIERNSGALAAMMNNGMQELQRGSAPLENVDISTFDRFVEFIYIGDYNPREPVELSLASPTAENASESGHNEASPDPDGSHRVVVEEPPTMDLDFRVAHEDWTNFSSVPKKKKSKKLKLPSATSSVVITPPLQTNSMFSPHDMCDLDHLLVFLSNA